MQAERWGQAKVGGGVGGRHACGESRQTTALQLDQLQIPVQCVSMRPWECAGIWTLILSQVACAKD
jgi:hypothetical protein